MTKTEGNKITLETEPFASKFGVKWRVIPPNREMTQALIDSGKMENKTRVDLTHEYNNSLIKTEVYNLD